MGIAQWQILWSRSAAACAGLALVAACGGPLVGVDVTVVDQKTALENQILGSYEEMGNEMMLLASVRSVDKDGKLKTVEALPPGKLQAIRAMQRREFNHDDIETFKKAGCAGEGKDGLLVFLECERAGQDPRFKKFAQTIIQEENEDRKITLKRIVATNEAFSEEDLPKVMRISASLNRDNAKPGEKIQLEDGTWTVKP